MSSENSTSPGEPQPAAGARKACDLCFRKKIKCDMLKPTCSNCSLYSAECRTSLIRQKPGGRARRRVGVQEAPEEASEDSEGIKARLERIEKLLKETAAQKAPNPSANSESPHFEVDSRSMDFGTDDQIHNSTAPTWGFDAVRPTLYFGPGAAGTPLPPLYDIMPLIDLYFDNFNQVSPIFDRKSFTRMVIEWYNQRATHSRVAWAAILAVCSLGLRASPTDNSLFKGPFTNKECSDYCLRNAQSVIPELLIREEDLLGVQTLLVLATLFHQACDQRAAGNLASMALRLAHRMRLHSKQSTEFFSPEEIQQRSNVFWVAYILDKDISMRMQMPSGQVDQDIDVSLPPMNPTGTDNDIGLIWTRDRTTPFNLFRMRLDLAHIQGKLYDLIYSNRSLKINAIERQARVESLQKLLTTWMARIPAAFQIEHVAATVGETEVAHMVKFYHSYLTTITFLHGIYSQQAEWVKRVGPQARYAIQDYTLAMSGHAADCLSEYLDPPAEKYWYHCVDISRFTLKLFQEVAQTDWLVWQCTCAHFSGLVILLSNTIMYPTHEFASLDSEISTVSVQLLDKIVAESSHGDIFASLQHVVADLSKHAKAAVSSARLQQDSERVFGQTFQEDDWFPGQSALSTFGNGDEADLTGTFNLNTDIDPFLHAECDQGSARVNLETIL
ncbi:unnamed protein product [Clonostachys byssicola]|uniref:Zn(2)-C6 fungal-type domain-containing protein n=1 Tax=Clonostachys byssicola TaxID=160290 RepID=A0A9N9Y906_9HYPO|nr:unnamed protein product [Clonostachys byssicola]